jgi:hypothetical protein
MKNFYLIMLPLLIISCQVNYKENSEPVGEEGWLKGTNEEKLEEVAHQLGGFSRTMVEVSYRYSELYWAGMDENWGYAEHQIEHIIEALEDGIKRRPLRSASAESFMKETIPNFEDVLAKKDKDAFLKGFTILTSACNACHAKEGESFITIQTPEIRTSPVRF